MSDPVKLRLVERMRLKPMPRNFLPRREPHAFMTLDILNHFPQRLEPSGLPDNPAVQTDCHHLRLALASLLVHDIERILAVVAPVLGVNQSVKCLQ